MAPGQSNRSRQESVDALCFSLQVSDKRDRNENRTAHDTVLRKRWSSEISLQCLFYSLNAAVYKPGRMESAGNAA